MTSERGFRIEILPPPRIPMTLEAHIAKGMFGAPEFETCRLYLLTEVHDILVQLGFLRQCEVLGLEIGDWREFMSRVAKTLHSNGLIRQFGKDFILQNVFDGRYMVKW